MKKSLILMGLALTAATASYAQNVQQAAEDAAKAIAGAATEAPAEVKPDYWKKSAQFSLGFNQTALFSWAAGGYNTANMAAGIDVQANYKKDLMSWNNRLQLDYGFLWSADKSDLLQKSKDRIKLESTWAYDLFNKSKWKYTASFDFTSQFTDSYSDYKQDASGIWSGTLKSGLLSPAYTNLGLGLEWKPNEWFDINISPLTGGFTIVTNPDLRGTYGMEKLEDGSFKSALFQFGAKIKMNAKATINDKFTYDTQLLLFTDYLDHPFVHNRVNWDNKITWKLAKLCSLGVSTWLIYDPLINIDGVVSKVQFKEFLEINFTYSIASK